MPAASSRARVRAELTAEIKEVARRHVADAGAASLSLRAVAREVGMVSSAVYRYFPSRDDLLTALIVDAFDAIGAVGEQAEAGSARTFVGRWVDLCGAVRGWALDNRHEYALVYGTPVPGYQAPRDTVDPAARIGLVVLRIVADGVAAGEIDTQGGPPIPRGVHRDLSSLRSATAVEIPDVVLSRALVAWTGVLGAISYELFGHLHGIVDDRDAFASLQHRQLARFLAGDPRNY